MSAFDPLRTLGSLWKKSGLDRLAHAIDNVRDHSSLYWGFYNSDEVVGGEEVVEVRFNASPQKAQTFTPPTGWSVHRVHRGEAVFLRRRQELTDKAVESMLVEMLQLAAAQGMQLHSWMHGSALD